LTKRTKDILVLIIASLIVQGIVFTFFNWKAEQLLNPYFQADKRFTIGFDFQDADSLALSFNNRYLSGIIEDNLSIIDLVNNKIVFNSEILEDNSSILSYKWLPDRNSLIFIRRSGLSPSSVSLYSVDLQTGNLPEQEFPEPVPVRSFELSVNEISSIGISTYTNNMYIVYRDYQWKQYISKIDIMKNINSLNLPQEEIQAMALSNKFGTLWLQSESREEYSIFAFDESNKRIVSSNTDAVLLGCLDERVFIGTVRNDQLQSIIVYNGEMENPEEQKSVFWQGEIEMNKPQDVVCNDDIVLLKNENSLEVIYADGRNLHKEIEKGHIFLLSQTGRMYLEIIPRNGVSTCFWRSLF